MTKYRDGLDAGAPLPKTGHRERKKQQIREQLIGAALRLFVERGYDQTRIDDIVAEVDVVPRTFFRYFASKDDALFGWYEKIRNESAAALQARPRGEGIVSALIASHIELAKAHREDQRIAQVVHKLCSSSPDIRARRAAWLYDLQRDAAKILASRLPASGALAAEMASGAVRAAFEVAAAQWAADGFPRPLIHYWQATAAKIMKVLDEIDRDYVLR